jgi:hypothetical protein
MISYIFLRRYPGFISGFFCNTGGGLASDHGQVRDAKKTAGHAGFHESLCTGVSHTTRTVPTYTTIWRQLEPAVKLASTILPHNVHLMLRQWLARCCILHLVSWLSILFDTNFILFHFRNSQSALMSRKNTHIFRALPATPSPSTTPSSSPFHSLRTYSLPHDLRRSIASPRFVEVPLPLC